MASSKYAGPKSIVPPNLPNYMRYRRQSFPAPFIGAYNCYTIGPFDVAGADSNRRVGTFVIAPIDNDSRLLQDVAPGTYTTPLVDAQGAQYIRVPGAGRVMAVSWHASAVSGAGPVVVVNYHSQPGGATGPQNLIGATNIALNTNRYGIITNEVTDITTLVGSGSDRADSTGGDTTFAWPDLQHTTSVGGALQLSVTGGGQTATNVMFCIWICPTSHVNMNKAND